MKWAIEARGLRPETNITIARVLQKARLISQARRLREIEIMKNAEMWRTLTMCPPRKTEYSPSMTEAIALIEGLGKGGCGAHCRPEGHKILPPVAWTRAIKEAERFNENQKAKA